MTEELTSIVVPVGDHRSWIPTRLRGLRDAIQDHPHEILICYDPGDKETPRVIERMDDKPPHVEMVSSEAGSGEAGALRAGFRAARGDVVVTLEADFSGDLGVIPGMAERIRREGAHVVTVAEAPGGGGQPGRPWWQGALSRLAGHLRGVMTGGLGGLGGLGGGPRAYSGAFLRIVEAEKRLGTAPGLELLSKAQQLGLKIDEVPGGRPPTAPARGRRRIWKSSHLYWHAQTAGASIFVWMTFGVLLLLSAGLAIRYSLPIPFWSEWEWVPYATGDRALSLDWLWSPEGGDRVFLPKLYYHLLMAKAFALDSRPFNLLSSFMLGGMAIVAILGVRSFRGRTHWSDVCLPVLILHGNHWANTTIPLGITVLLPSLLLCIAISRILCYREDRGEACAAIVGACLVGMSLCGRVTLPAVLLLSPWLIWIEIRRYGKSRRSARFRDGFGIALAILALALTILQFPREAGEISPGAGASLGMAAKCLALGLGHKSVELWPLSGVVICALGGLSGVILIGTLWREPSRRVPASGLLVALAALCGSALLIGHESAARGRDTGFAFPYTTLMCLVPLIVYFSGEVCSWPGVARSLRVLLPMLAWILLWPNFQEGAQMAELRQANGKAFVKDLSEGRTLLELASLHSRRWNPSTERFVLGLKRLRDARMGVFRNHPGPDLMRLKPDLWSVEMLQRGTADSGKIFHPRGGGPALIAHPVSMCSWRLPEGTRRVRFAFGMTEASYTGGLNTDGVEFRLDLEGPDGKREALWKRHLDPMQVEADRGLQTGSVEIPMGRPAPSRLIFVTLKGPAGNGLWDWSYWADVEFITP